MSALSGLIVYRPAVFRLLVSQLRLPTGFSGRLVAKWMNSYNWKMTEAAIDELALDSGDSVLDLGFGGGQGIRLLLDHEQCGLVAGVELSETMISAARNQFRRAIDAGRLVLRAGRVEAIPCPDACFDRVLTVNTVYFWGSLQAGMAEIARTLKPRGRVVLGMRPAGTMSRLGLNADGFRLYSPEQVAAALGTAGFHAVSWTPYRLADQEFILVYGTRDS